LQTICLPGGIPRHKRAEKECIGEKKRKVPAQFIKCTGHLKSELKGRIESLGGGIGGPDHFVDAEIMWNRGRSKMECQCATALVCAGRVQEEQVW